jgi:hypothetical protein
MRLKRLFVVLFVLLSFVGFSQRDVEVTYESGPQGKIVFSCTNNTRCDQVVKVNFQTFANLKSDCRMPFIGTVIPGTSILFTLTKLNYQERIDFSYNYVSIPGKFRPRIKKEFPYIFPVTNGQKTKVLKIDNIRKFLRQKSNKEYYAYGFSMNVGDTIYASRGGTVCNISNKNPAKGESLVYSADAAYVKVYHRDGTFGTYSRIDGNKILVESGQFINPGDPIGIVFSEGYKRRIPCVIFSLSRTDCSKLDDIQFTPKSIEAISLPVMFVYNQNTINYIDPNIEYKSCHSPEVITKEMSRRKRKKWLKTHKVQ